MSTIALNFIYTYTIEGNNAHFKSLSHKLLLFGLKTPLKMDIVLVRMTSF